MQDSNMADAEVPNLPTIAKADVTSKIVEFLSGALAPTEDGNYAKTVTDILHDAYAEPDKQTAFRNKLQEWEICLH